MSDLLDVDDITMGEYMEELDVEWPCSENGPSERKPSWFWFREVTSQDAENGMDVQGITWDSFNVTRQRYRELRLIDYKNYENVPRSHDEIKKEIKPVRTDSQFYKFKYTTLSNKCSIVHFQLRNLLWSTGRNDVFYTHSSRITYWNSIMKTSKVALDLNYNNRNAETPFEISTIACKDNYLLVGGLYGEYACRRLDADPIHFGTITTDSNGITNHMDIVESRTGGIVAVISSNDRKSRIMDLATLKFIDTYDFQWPVNCTAVSPNKKLLCVVGDDTDTVIASADSGKNIATLKGHIDYSFACCWSPDGRIIATGNQDKTTRLYDMRNLSKAFNVLGAKIGAVRSLHFSEDGRYLAMAEPADFVHIFDAHTFDRSQVIDLFGEIAGVTFTPDTDGLYIANADENFGCILEYERIHSANHIGNIFL
ncbi:WD40 repeat-like protein [Gigaspora margarita]|uniref:WD40 repeat-like protein n=1 Tax=Gigaspora margarita TaxID=4874 RepID=A0A8H3X3P0_GIGMA|nr:WD40 repeat-like protein [Gigaspora margarita]